MGHKKLMGSREVNWDKTKKEKKPLESLEVIQSQRHHTRLFN